MMNDIHIGIDLGTTNSCAAYYFDHKIKILENDEGGRVTPSVVAYTKNNQTIVGNLAKKVSIVKPEYSVYEIKRLVGRKTSDLYVQKNLPYFPFKIDPESDEPVVLIEHQNQTIRKTPQEICTTILKKIKFDVESKLGIEIKNAVITVPAYFNVSQREVTLAAAKEAGLTVMKLMNEPTAAALSYFYESKNKDDKHCLVFDFGGGTFDVAILKRNENNIEIIGVDGDSHLGGQDIDNLIVDFVCDKLKDDYKFDCRQNRRLMRRLHNFCEEAKKDLSFVDSATIILESFVKDHDVIEIELTRTQLETLTDNLFKKSLNIVGNCLKSCNLIKDDIGEIILSGGTTRIPKLRNMLSEFFGYKSLQKLVNPDECVAEGAALQAAMLSANPKQKIQSIRITDVTALSLGKSTLADVMSFVIKRNTPLPVTESVSYCTVNNQQTAILFKIFEGERLNATKNRFLGKFRITNLTPAPPGQCSVIFTMSIDSNGILHVKAQEKFKDNVKELTVTYTRGIRSDSEVRNTMKDAEDHKEEDEKFMIFAVYKTYLIHYCKAVEYNLESANLVETNKELYDLCKSTSQKTALMQMNPEDEIKKLIKQIENKCHSLIEQYKFKLIPTLENVAESLNVTLPLSVLI